jgi:trimeric autotransporter adhesin
MTATAPDHQVSVTGTGLNFNDIRIQLFSGSCGVLSSLACGGWNWGGRSAVNYGSFVPGNTYYVRVFTETAGITIPGGFDICVLAPSMNLYTDKSFVNITRGIAGGTVEPGNVLEIRATVVVQGSNGLPVSVDSCAFFDNIPSGTTYIPGSLAIVTNEGKLYKSFTDAPSDDAGEVVGSAIRVNLGFSTADAPATALRRGRLRSSHRPTSSGATIFMVTYRVTVTQSLGGTLNIGGGSFTYSLPTAPTTVLTRNFSPNLIKVYTNNGLCSNSTGINVLTNNLAGDFSGTFGNGNTMNRVASPNVSSSYNYTPLNGSAPGDTYYGVANNTSSNSAGFTTVNTWPKPESPSIHRIFSVFDIIGDHTGATNPIAGNPPADTTNGGTGGYMLLVNASFSTDTAFKYRITNLCPGTFYEISAWVRNICSMCGTDSTGQWAGSLSSLYIPTGPGDSSGVKPNLSFSVDGVNHYTTGDINYTGQWVKKGFIFQTGSVQPDITFTISNNSPGGGGNDWVLDDINITTCTPNLSLTPSGNSNVCLGNQVNMSCLVSSFFPNYTYWEWERSDDNGATWYSTGVNGNTAPTWNGTAYEYTANYPPFIGDASMHFKQFRLKVATTAANLAGSSCSFLASNRIVVMVNGCQWVLNTDLISFDGKLKDNQAQLNWKIVNEQQNIIFEVERSLDGVNFTKIGQVIGKGVSAGGEYDFTDKELFTGKAYYRVKMIENEKYKYSRVVLLSAGALPFEVRSLINPVINNISFDAVVPAAGEIKVTLYDAYGKTIYNKSIKVNKGINEVSIDQASVLGSGQYVVKVQWGTQTITKRVIKLDSK